MSLRTISVVCLIAAATPLSVIADEHEDAQPYIYSSYLYCDTATQARADTIFEKQMKNIYDQAVTDGTISGWGWLVHHTGGKWRRASYHVAPDLESLLAAGDKLSSETAKQRDADEFSEICSSHEDYIWRSVTGSAGSVAAAPRGKVGLSVYHVCDLTKESRADEIVKSVIGPVFDEHTGEGKLTSWGWAQHIVGGKYRRLATMTAGDWSTLFKMRNAIFEALDGNELADQFSEICGSHSDYLWDIRHENP